MKGMSPADLQKAVTTSGSDDASSRNLQDMPSDLKIEKVECKASKESITLDVAKKQQTDYATTAKAAFLNGAGMVAPGLAVAFTTLVAAFLM